MSICPSCKKELDTYVAKVKSGYTCWKCKDPMNIFIICEPEQEHFDMCSAFAYRKPENIIEIANRYGVLMQKRYTNFVRDEYIAHICPHCDSLQGDNYVVMDNHQWESTKTEKKINLLHCSSCNQFFESKDIKE